MNADATMSMDIVALARELRDLIYENVVGTKYRFDTYQILNGVPHFSEPPTLYEPCGDSSRELFYDPAIGDLRIVPISEFRHESMEVLYEYPFPPRPSLSILQTSTRVREEALHVLYHKGTLLFVLNHPSHSGLSTMQSQDLMTHFNNVEIFLDLVAIFNHSFKPSHEARAIKFTMELIERLGDSASAASTCTLSTYYRYDNDTFETSFFDHLIDTASKLFVFRKVVLRFGNSSRTAEEDYAGSSTELAAERLDTDEWAVHTYREFLLNENFWCLGPCKEGYDSEGFFCMVFYPRNQLGRGGSSNLGMD